MLSSVLQAGAVTAAAVCVIGAAADCRADDALPLPVAFNAFGTLGLTYSSERDADFVSSSNKAAGAGHSRAWSPVVDSLVAGQVAIDIAPGWSAVVQAIAEQDEADHYLPRVEWANVKYQVTPEFSVRIGRIALSTFLVTDSRNVDFANPWLRPPGEVYNLVPITNNDGIDASYHASFGSIVNTLQLAAGRSSLHFPKVGSVEREVKVRKTFTVTETVEKGYATFHVSVSHTLITIPSLAPLFGAFRQFGAEGAAIADRYDVQDRPSTFVGVGGSYDPGDWFAMAEWGEVNSRSITGRSSAWYASGGYRFGQFTPYVTYAHLRGQSSTSDPGLAVGTLPPMAAGVAAALNAALATGLAMRGATQSTMSVGVRWDVVDDGALHFQFDRIHLGAGSAGTLINLQPGFRPGGKLNVISANYSFVH